MHCRGLVFVKIILQMTNIEWHCRGGFDCESCICISYLSIKPTNQLIILYLLLVYVL